jgi:ClpP class serine protease
MALHAAHSNRNLIVYATAFTQAAPGIPPGVLSISDGDMQGVMEVVSDLDGGGLDFVIHSPGGSIEAAEALVRYLRSKFDHIRVFVPHLAMSAATMIACAADKIVMGGHSSLGPVDPQLQMQTPLGIRSVPADAVIAQFERAQRECLDPRKLGSWAPMLNQYGPDLLEQCENAQNLSKDLVKEWLASYMFNGQEDAEQKSISIAKWLANHKERGTHNIFVEMNCRIKVWILRI